MTMLKLKKNLFFLLLLFAGFGCGVRGDPIPPGAPTDLGYGSPSYAAPEKQMKPTALPTRQQVEEEEKKDQEKDKK